MWWGRWALGRWCSSTTQSRELSCWHRYEAAMREGVEELVEEEELENKEWVKVEVV